MAEKILVVDDDPDIRQLIVLTLGGHKQVVTAGDGQDALDRIKAEPFDLVLLDVMMPKLDGLEVCRRIRQNIATRYLPVIMLTAKGTINDQLIGIKVGADDYITKPFNPLELEARVEMHLRRHAWDTQANPLTGLPGNVPIEQTIMHIIGQKAPASICYTDLDHFKAFNDRYGFVAGDEVIRLTAQILTESVSRLGTPTDFVAHIGGDDFVFFTDPEHHVAICEEVTHRFDREILGHYKPEDLANGGITVADRLGERRFFPIMTLSIVVVTNQWRDLKHPGQVAQVAVELMKDLAKNLETYKSKYVIDVRKQ